MDSKKCIFCTELIDIESSEFRELFHKDILSSRLIKSTPNFVVLAGLGTIRPGYVLILPKEHVLSFAFLDKSTVKEAEELKADVIQQMMAIFPSLIVFEHGPVTANSSSGGCIDHAHLHIFPTSIDLFPHLSQEFRHRRIYDVGELSFFRDIQKHYIYYERMQEKFAFEIDRPIPSQYLRRLIYAAEGLPDEWDWGVFVGYDHIVNTVKLLK